MKKKRVTVLLSPKLHSKLCVDARVSSCSVEDLIVRRLEDGYELYVIEDEGLLRRFARKQARERRNRLVVIGPDGLRV